MKTLFVDASAIAGQFMFVYSLSVSVEFIKCADTQLTEQFVKETGIKAGKNACISITEHYIGTPIYTTYLIEGTYIFGRKFMIQLYINHNWNPVTIYWKSKSNRDYKPHDIDIDCSDIVFWFEKLDKKLYADQMKSKGDL